MAAPLSGVALEPGVEDCIESDELAGGVAVSEGVAGVLAGALDCIELSAGAAGVSVLVACCCEQAAASASVLRHKIDKSRLMGGTSHSWDR